MTSSAQPPSPSENPGNSHRWWAIGMYAGKSPLKLAPIDGIVNPVLSARDIDVPARFVADPFMLKVDGLRYMFFEVMSNVIRKGKIAFAISRDGLVWQYQKIVLEEPFHLSYPYVFRWKDDFYMIPETLEAGAARLYRALSFPERWVAVKDLLPGELADSSIFHFDDKWWLFTCPTPGRHDVLCLYYATEPTAQWQRHECNPIVRGDPRRARPAGRVLTEGDRLVRFAQDCYPTYGRQVRAFEITELTTKTYKEQEAVESPILSPGEGGWNGCGMHHVDVQRTDNGEWLACVDGLVNF